jgi:hypothetical protein
MSADSVDLQTAIDQKVLELGSVKTPEARRNAWNELQALIKSRPPEVVRKMEIERGLTR